MAMYNVRKKRRSKYYSGQKNDEVDGELWNENDSGQYVCQHCGKMCSQAMINPCPETGQLMCFFCAAENESCGCTDEEM